MNVTLGSVLVHRVIINNKTCFNLPKEAKAEISGVSPLACYDTL